MNVNDSNYKAFKGLTTPGLSGVRTVTGWGIMLCAFGMTHTCIWRLQPLSHFILWLEMIKFVDGAASSVTHSWFRFLLITWLMNRRRDQLWETDGAVTHAQAKQETVLTPMITILKRRFTCALFLSCYLLVLLQVWLTIAITPGGGARDWRH